MKDLLTACGLAALVLCASQSPVQAGAIRNLAGFNTTTYGPNDDGSYNCTSLDVGEPFNCTPVPVPIGFTISFYGNTRTELYVNNNGNVTFGAPLSEFTPFGLAATATQIIAPFFADVDTRVGNVVSFGNDVVDGHPAFGVNWINVGYFDGHPGPNSFQLILIQRSDRHTGDFDIEFNYDQVQWETGDASGGTGGLGGSSAVVGFSNGSGLPGTSFELHGSAIPGQFLDGNPGGLIHRSLNSTVPGRYVIPIINLPNTLLNVQRFSQGDSRWATNAYGTSTSTIAQEGSALSCLAMALKYAGLNTDPGALNTLLKNKADFVGTSLNWSAATRDAANNTLTFHAFRANDLQFLSQSLAAGHPVIVGVNLDEAGVPGHFVLVVGYQNGQYVILDPGHANHTSLADFSNDFESRGYVTAPAGDVSSLVASVDNGAELLAVDFLGRRVGRVAGQILEEVPQSSYFLDNPEQSDLTGAPGTNTAHQVDLFQPAQGVYQFFLFGQANGTYKLTLRSFTAAGVAGTPVTLQGTINVGDVIPFQFNLGPSGPTAQPFVNACPWTASPTTGPFPLSVQFNAPYYDNLGNPIIEWDWSFGDGATGSGMLPAHTYTKGGIYFPALTAVSSTGATLIGSGPAIIIPCVQFTANPTHGSAPMTVQFTCPSVDNLGVPISQWNWDFGDGYTSTQQSPSHTYAANGSYTPILSVVDIHSTTVPGVGPKLLLVPDSGLVFNGGFESEDFTGWNLTGDTYFAWVDHDLQDVHSGQYGASLTTMNAVGYLSQLVPTLPGRSYLVSLWLNPDGATPSLFRVKWAGTTLFEGLDSPALGWTNIQLTATASSTSAILELGFQNDNGYFGLDEVSVRPLQPTVLSLGISGSALIMQGKDGLDGRTYRVLRSTNAALPFSQWTPIQTNVLNGNGAFTFTLPTQVIPGTGQRFYTIQLQ